MTATEILQLQELYARYNHRCFICDNPATQRAHIIGDTKSNRIKYGKIIDNPLNWLPACGLQHNGYIDISRNTKAADEVFAIITGVGSDYSKRKEIEKIVSENVARKVNKLLTE